MKESKVSEVFTIISIIIFVLFIMIVPWFKSIPNFFGLWLIPALILFLILNFWIIPMTLTKLVMLIPQKFYLYKNKKRKSFKMMMLSIINYLFGGRWWYLEEE